MYQCQMKIYTHAHPLIKTLFHSLRAPRHLIKCKWNIFEYESQQKCRRFRMINKHSWENRGGNSFNFRVLNKVIIKPKGPSTRSNNFQTKSQYILPCALFWDDDENSIGKMLNNFCQNTSQNLNNRSHHC